MFSTVTQRLEPSSIFVWGTLPMHTSSLTQYFFIGLHINIKLLSLLMSTFIFFTHCVALCSWSCTLCSLLPLPVCGLRRHAAPSYSNKVLLSSVTTAFTVTSLHCAPMELHPLSHLYSLFSKAPVSCHTVLWPRRSFCTHQRAPHGCLTRRVFPAHAFPRQNTSITALQQTDGILANQSKPAANLL